MSSKVNAIPYLGFSCGLVVQEKAGRVNSRQKFNGPKTLHMFYGHHQKKLLSLRFLLTMEKIISFKETKKLIHIVQRSPSIPLSDSLVFTVFVFIDIFISHFFADISSLMILLSLQNKLLMVSGRRAMIWL